ncbi:MAG: bile acid:sodium symporter family protein [Chloroflexota bacterium]|jgi:BASS family bile acid:Na+ symporter
MTPELLQSLLSAFTLAFAVSSMFSMGLHVTVDDVLEPLQDLRLVVKSLAANFVIVPAAALLLARSLIADQGLQIGLILIATAAGAPLVPKLAQIAGGSLRFAVGLVVLLLVGTVIYLPLMLPLLLPGVQVDVLDVATPLFLQMLLPLAAGFFVDARYPEEADWLHPVMGQIANGSLALVLVLTVGLNIELLLGIFGSGAIIATLLLLAISVVGGYLLGGPQENRRRTLALGTGQRNIAAAFVVGTSSFPTQPTVLLMLTVAGLLSFFILFPIAGEFRRRSGVTT